MPIRVNFWCRFTAVGCGRLFSSQGVKVNEKFVVKPLKIAGGGDRAPLLRQAER